MVSISQKARWCQKILERIQKAKEKGDKHAVSRFCGYYRIPVKSVYDWFKRWDGTWKSLEAKSHRPHRHPKAHTEAEVELMIKIRREKGFIEPLLMYQELLERGYTRSYGGMKRFLRKRFASPTAPLASPEKPKAYEGGKYPGDRVQIDVKFVPKLCLYGEKLYQYTLVYEFSRWCYREIHNEHSAYISGLFIRRAAKAAPFKIREAQTDNGHEFTNAIFGQSPDNPTRFEQALVELSIEYRRIRVGTPKHNGRVERQHGLDMIRFYKRKRQKFSSLEDIREKLAEYNTWSNTRIKTCLNFRSPLQVIAGL